MSPLPKHEVWNTWIARLVEIICLDRSIIVGSFGSTTFRTEMKRKGLEPDRCFYIQNAELVTDMEEEFDPAIHPAPDLALEIDITSRSINREPIYAALGVPELWRFDGAHLEVLHLTGKQAKYAKRSRSLAFPFLPMAEFEKFVRRRKDKNQLVVLSEFRKWVKGL
jgi:Uma2 family endonuclease